MTGQVSGPAVCTNFSPHSSVPRRTDVNSNVLIPLGSNATRPTSKAFTSPLTVGEDSSLPHSTPPETTKLPTTLPQVRKRKVSYSGTIKRRQSISFILLFDSVPWWLLALDSDYVESIAFFDFLDYPTLESIISTRPSGTTFLSILEMFKDKLEFGPSVIPSSKHIVLLSGSIHFLTSHRIFDEYSIDNWLFISTEMRKFRTIPVLGHQLHRVSHKHHGGATDAELLFSSSIPTFVCDRTPLRRSIGDFIDFSIRPKPSSSKPSTYVVQASSLMPSRFLETPILISTSFTATGFGLRVLNNSELSHLFGLPTNLHSFFRVQDFPIIPVQILDAVLSGFLDSNPRFGMQPTFLNTPAKKLCLPKPILDFTPEFLPELNRSLPPLWSRVEAVTDKAAKADDALVPLHMWDNRVVPLFSSFTPRVLALFRDLVMRKYRRKLYLEFIKYLRTRYTTLYIEFLALRSKIYFKIYSKRLRGVQELRCSHYSSETEMTNDENILVLQSYINDRRFYALINDIQFGVEGLHCISNSTYFSWNAGSSLLFWRWDSRLQHIAKYGFPTHVCNELPSNFRRPKKPSKKLHSKILAKIVKSVRRNYLKPASLSKVKNLIDYFAVPKAEDIRLVLNGSSCGLNKAVWASNFWLPTALTMTRQLGFNYKFVDIDLGEMFLNFPLDPKLIYYSGMDVSHFKDEIESQIPGLKFDSSTARSILVNTRNWMGFRPSPEWSCRFYYLGEEFIRGDETSLNNPLRWDRIILNLPGNEDFNPSLPFVMKWNDVVKRQAGNLIAYVDDLRIIGWSMNHAWSIAHRVASRLQYLGVQDAPRKRRIDNGPWAGSIFLTSPTTIQKTVTQEKWSKAKTYIEDLVEKTKNNLNFKFEFKYLERIRGFLCHLGMTYDLLFPFLKGFHLTLCSFLPKRNDQGWKIKDLEWIGFLESSRSAGKLSDEEVQAALDYKYDPKYRPKFIVPVPRFHQCLEALKIFFDKESPPIITERTSYVQLVIYGFVDASKSGFGSSIDYDGSIKYRIGTWGPDQDTESSNFREFCNLVETLEHEASMNRLNNSTIIIATDNSTVESCIYKGNSTNHKLFDLIIRFKDLELKTGSKFLITHVSGKRMMHQGTDGISRGHLREGVSLGASMLSFCPWGLCALERSSTLLPWLKEVFGRDLEVLSPVDWYRRGHDHLGGKLDEKGFYRLNIQPGTYLWHPPPAAADAAIEELRKARLKRRRSTHIVVIPRLVTTLWLKQLYKSADFLITIPNTHPFWPEPMLEPLVLAISFPYSRHNPWQLKSTPKLLQSQREVYRLLQADPLAGRDILQEFFSSTLKLPTLSPSLVWSLLHFQPRSLVPNSSSSGTTSNKRKRVR